jgi:uncharacterized protein (DUF736 family)
MSCTKSQFTETEYGFTGKLETLTIKANLTLQPYDDKDIHPDFIVLHGQNEIGVAWNRDDRWGTFVSLVRN